MADLIARPLSVNFERSRQTGEVTEDQKKANVTFIFKKVKNKFLRNYRLVTLTSIPSKVMEQVILETKNKNIIGKTQHGFIKRKLCLMNKIALYDEMTVLVNDGRAGVIYLKFSKVLLQYTIKSS